MKKAAIINDLSGFGKCSLAAAVPVLNVMGIQAAAVPTGIFSNQTGYEHYFALDLTEKIEEYCSHWLDYGESFDAVLTGFTSSASQADIIAGLIKRLKKENTLVLVDPVMADNGEIYKNFTREHCNKIRSLALSADIITPNFSELCVLCSVDFNEAEKIAFSKKIITFMKSCCGEILKSGVKSVIVTSAPVEQGLASNFIFSNEGEEIISSEKIGGSYSGTGDLFAACVCAGVLNNLSLSQSVGKAVSFIGAALRASFLEGTDPKEGICFEPFLKML